jgi:hypothetical protein
MLPNISHDRPDDGDLDVLPVGKQLARQQAITQIGRRRRFWFWAAMGTLVMIIVTASWAFSQYHDAGGWPTHGFTQSSWPLIPNVWNDWIIWPAMVWALATAGYAWFVFGNKPISEGEIKREIDRQAGHPTPSADEKKVR